MVDPWQFQIKDGRQLTIRPVRPDDVRDLYEAARHPDVARTLALHPAMELAATKAFINEAPPGRHYLVAEVGERAVGSVTLNHVQRPRLQHTGVIGLMVGREHWGQGIGGFLMEVALEIADNWLNLSRLELAVFAQNPAAIHLYEKFGFEKEGLRRCHTYGDGGWLDSYLMARLRNVDTISEQRAAESALPEQERKSSSAGGRQPLIRPPQPDDTEDLHNLYSNPLVARTTLQMPSQEISLSRRRMEQHPPGLYRLVAEMDGRVIGSISLHQEQNPRVRHAAGLGMGVHPDYWGQGVGNALMLAILDLADNWLNLMRLELDVNVDNVAGVRLYLKHGFEIEGTRRYHAYGDGRWADSYFMGRLRG